MKIIQKYIVIASVVLMLSGLFSGCGWNTTYIPPVTVTHPPLEPTTITPPVQTPPVTTTTGEVALPPEQQNWKLYQDTNNGFRFHYPPELTMYVPVAPGPIAQIVQFQFPPSWYQGTNLADAMLGVGVSASCPKDYNTAAYSGTLPATVQNQDRLTFARNYAEEGAAGNHYKVPFYSLVSEGSCYVVVLNLHSTNRMAADQTPREYDPKKFEEVLAKVVSTFKIVQ